MIAWRPIVLAIAAAMALLQTRATALADGSVTLSCSPIYEGQAATGIVLSSPDLATSLDCVVIDGDLPGYFPAP